MSTVLLCYSGTVLQSITQIGGTDKDLLPLVQMSKAFMKIPNVIQPDPTNKDLLYFTQKTIRVSVIAAAEHLIIDR